MTMTLVSTVTVGSGGASKIEWTGIAQTGKDLLVVVSARFALSGTADPLILGLNGSTGSFTARRLYSDGSTAASNTSVMAGQVPAASVTANVFSNQEIYVEDYKSSAAKAISVNSVMENNATTSYAEILALKWSDTNAITSLSLEPFSTTTFVQYSTASLYIIS